MRSKAFTLCINPQFDRRPGDTLPPFSFVQRGVRRGRQVRLPLFSTVRADEGGHRERTLNENYDGQIFSPLPIIGPDRSPGSSASSCVPAHSWNLFPLRRRICMRPIDRVNVSQPMTNESAGDPRRKVLIDGAIMAAGMSLPRAASALSIHTGPQLHPNIAKEEIMSHHLDSPIARQTFALTSPISTHSAVKRAPYW